MPILIGSAAGILSEATARMKRTIEKIKDPFVSKDASLDTLIAKQERRRNKCARF
jgi:hypothetical protein